MSLLNQLLHNRKALVGVTILAIVILVAVFAPLLTEYSPTQRVGRPHQAPSADHWLGTTRLGYDVFTRLLYGARVSLAVGFGAGLLITVIGTVSGVEERKVGDVPYRYPVLLLERIRLWPRDVVLGSDYYYPWGPWPYYDPYYYWPRRGLYPYGWWW